MQAPGGPEEDQTGSFTYGGWTVPYFDDWLGQTMAEQMSQPFDLLLGRKTFEIFAAYWPHQESPINDATKYVASRTLTTHAWKKTVLLKGDVVEDIRQLKQQEGPELQVHGSGNLIQTLLAHDLVDELWLKIFPVTLGQGRRLFAEGITAAAFTLREAKTSPAGVMVASYERAGAVKTGSFVSACKEPGYCQDNQNKTTRPPLLVSPSPSDQAPMGAWQREISNSQTVHARRKQ